MASPFFILSAPRSGSTLLRMVLDAHPRISVVLESIWFNLHAVRLRRLLRLPPPRRDQAILAYLMNVPASAPLKQLLPAEAALRQAIAEAQGDLGKLFGTLCGQWARQQSGPDCVWGEKSVGHSLHIEDIRQAFPQARFLHLLRDPRATVYSMSKKSFTAYSDNVFINAHHWKRYYDLTRRGLAAVPPSNQLTVYYEDFVRHPEEQTRRICQFLGVDFDPIVLEHHRFQKEIPGYKGSAKANEPISTSFLEEWCADLRPVQIVCLEEFALDPVLRQRYPPSNPPVNGLAKTATRLWMGTLHALLTRFEAVVSRLRGRPFVWSRLGSMARNFVFGPPQ